MINKNLSFARILFVFLVFYANSLFAQDEKQIWTTCIDSIYRKETTVLIYPNEKLSIDPINPQTDTTDQRIEYIPFTLYIDRSIRKITVDEFRSRLKDMLNVKTIRNMRFSEIIEADSLTIDDSQLRFCHKTFNSNRYKVKLDTVESCTGNNVGYTTAKSISLSDILVSDNGKYVVLHALMRYKDARIYAVLLKKEKRRWKIVKMARSFYR